MKKILRFISSVLCIFTVALTVGCGGGNDDAIVYFEASQKPETLDPQTAKTDTELLIAENIFEGLLRYNSNGEIVNGMAESFEKQGFTYIFKIRRNAVWSNGTPLTAHDFVFGFRRAVMPETKSPYASRLFCIENAEKVNKGSLNAEALGISAQDDYTLKITLQHEDEFFEQALTTSVAMPCNEDFFKETAGKYGLTTKTVISCGSYRLTKWNDDPFGIRIKRNPDYNGNFKALNAAVYITMDDEKSAFDRLYENNVDITFLDSSLAEAAEKSNFEIIEYDNICWFLTVGNGISQDLRRSFALLILDSAFEEYAEKGYSVAASVYPPTVFNGTVSSGMTEYDFETAKRLYKTESARLENGKLPADFKLYYYDDGDVKSVVTDIVGHWQSSLGAYINITPIQNADELIGEIASPTLDMAFFPVKAVSTRLYEYAQIVGIEYNGENHEQLQRKILSYYNIFPVMYQSTVIAHSKALNNVFTVLGNGYIDFSFIEKTEN